MAVQNIQIFSKHYTSGIFEKYVCLDSDLHIKVTFMGCLNFLNTTKVYETVCYRPTEMLFIFLTLSKNIIQLFVIMIINLLSDDPTAE